MCGDNWIGCGRRAHYGTMPPLLGGRNTTYVGLQGEGERKHGGKRTPFCGLTVTFLVCVSGTCDLPIPRNDPNVRNLVSMCFEHGRFEKQQSAH